MPSSPKRLLITGSNGQLGTALRHHPLAANAEVIYCDHTSLDITEPASIEQALIDYAPDVIINCAAYTAVDKAESENKTCLHINYEGALQLALAAENHHIPLLHLSTDYVFDGKSTTPYLEDHPTNPLGIYGLSKWQGEEAIRTHCEQYLILRVSGVFSEYGQNFYKTILRLASERKLLRIVADQTTCPTHAADIAGTIYTIAQKLNHFGTYHYCSNSPTSWHGFATSIVAANQHKALQVETIEAISTAEYPTAAKRPLYSVLNCEKIKRDYAILQPSWEKAVLQLGEKK